MNAGVIANRYAKALLAFASSRDAMEAVHRDVLTLQQALTDELSRKGDDGILSACIARLGPELQQFLRVVAENGRADHLPSMLRQFILFYNRQKGIATASLVTAAPAPSLEGKLLAMLRDKGYTEVDFTQTVSSALIGGFVLQIEDQRLDASLSTQLKTLKQAFEEKNKRIV